MCITIDERADELEVNLTNFDLQFDLHDGVGR